MISCQAAMRCEVQRVSWRCSCRMCANVAVKRCKLVALAPCARHVPTMRYLLGADGGDGPASGERMRTCARILQTSNNAPPAPLQIRTEENSLRVISKFPKLRHLLACRSGRRRWTGWRRTASPWSRGPAPTTAAGAQVRSLLRQAGQPFLRHRRVGGLSGHLPCLQGRRASRLLIFY